MAKPFHSLSFGRVVNLNKAVISDSGGFRAGSDNVINGGSLEFVLDAVLFPVFGNDLYPEVVDKIAAIAQTIITRHIFRDGNKRTGLAVIVALARANNIKFVPDKDAEDFMVEIAAKSLSVETVSDWLRKKMDVSECGE